MIINLIAQLPAAGVGFVVGCFCPAVARKIKAFFVKETTSLKQSAQVEVTKIEKKL